MFVLRWRFLVLIGIGNSLVVLEIMEKGFLVLEIMENFRNLANFTFEMLKAKLRGRTRTSAWILILCFHKQRNPWYTEIAVFQLSKQKRGWSCFETPLIWQTKDSHTDEQGGNRQLEEGKGRNQRNYSAPVNLLFRLDEGLMFQLSHTPKWNPFISYSACLHFWDFLIFPHMR